MNGLGSELGDDVCDFEKVPPDQLEGTTQVLKETKYNRVRVRVGVDPALHKSYPYNRVGVRVGVDPAAATQPLRSVQAVRAGLEGHGDAGGDGTAICTSGQGRVRSRGRSTYIVVGSGSALGSELESGLGLQELRSGSRFTGIGFTL